MALRSAVLAREAKSSESNQRETGKGNHKGKHCGPKETPRQDQLHPTALDWSAGKDKSPVTNATVVRVAMRETRIVEWVLDDSMDFMLNFPSATTVLWLRKRYAPGSDG